MRIAVIGAGSWGSAVAWLLANKGHSVSLWARDAALVATLNETHKNPRYLSDSELPASVVATTQLDQALNHAESVVLVTPSAATRAIAQKLAATGCLGTDVPLVLLSKGIEGGTGLLLLDVLEQELGNPARLAVLSGPNHAEEVALGIPAGTVIASSGQDTAVWLQELFSTPAFRVYTSADVIGVQLCGAAKNIIAIAVGMSAGLGYGDNTAAVIITRGLAEISRLVSKVGGEQLTCMGLAGMGDLIATCMSRHSRNRGFGLALAQGMTLEQYEQQRHMVVEGALACKAVCDLARTQGVEMPISEQVRSVVWEAQPLDAMIWKLLDRSSKPEFY
ncbi:MAG: NAD(P)-dependent glycerol-3-phosphate dehydrogenase [Coriobacteriales bacterium]|jgi:glycerol-3-phosphate dehydrogenase (NAD(P)+)|nr:NAD(P)-dependent glycerol-3-phosphate dehydrogenase [Coriobacteriales bacterium]